MTGEDQFTERVTVRFSGDELRQIRIIANRMGISLADVVRTSSLAFIILVPNIPKEIADTIRVRLSDHEPDRDRKKGRQLHRENVDVPGQASK